MCTRGGFTASTQTIFHTHTHTHLKGPSFPRSYLTAHSPSPREAARGEGLCVCVMCGGWVDENDEWGKRWTCHELGPFGVVGRKERGRQVGQWCSSEWLGDVSRSAPPPSPSAAWYSIRPPPSPVTAGFRLPSQDRCRTPHSVQPHGVQRPGDRGPEWSACAGPLPCRCLGEI